MPGEGNRAQSCGREMKERGRNGEGGGLYSARARRVGQHATLCPNGPRQTRTGPYHTGAGKGAHFTTTYIIIKGNIQPDILIILIAITYFWFPGYTRLKQKRLSA